MSQTSVLFTETMIQCFLACSCFEDQAKPEKKIPLKHHVNLDRQCMLDRTHEVISFTFSPTKDLLQNTFSIFVPSLRIQIRLDISCELSAGRQFTCNKVLMSQNIKIDITNMLSSVDWGFEG